MKQSLNVAIFGFSLNVLEQLKSQVSECLPYGVDVQWVNIAEQKIDLLLVNDIFYSASNIQKVIKHQTSAYLRLIKDLTRTGQIDSDVLHYPLQKYDQFSEWLQTTFFDYEPLVKVKAPMIKPAVQNEDVRDVFREMFIPRNGFIQLYDHIGFVALVDCMTERVWLNERSQSYVLNAKLNHTYATGQLVNEITKDRQALDLRAWLWNCFANTELPINDIHHHQYFKLTIWPQFQTGESRRHQMKMAAIFALGASIEEVAQQIDQPIEDVKQFVATAALMQLGHYVDASEAKFEVKKQETEKSTGQSIRGFFSKLRKKIGL